MSILTLALLALAKLLLLVLLFALPLAAVLTWAERRQSAMIQDRLGPNRANIGPFRLWGLLHVVADGLKMLFKEDTVPGKAHRALFALAPVLAMAPVLIAFAIIPFGPRVCPHDLGRVLPGGDVALCRDGVLLQVAQLDAGILFYFAIASLSVYGLMLAGWASYNKWSLLGGLRASSQMFAYEVTMGMAILGTFLVFGTLEPTGMVAAQTAEPWRWGLVVQPLGFLLFLTAAIAETKRAPFDLPEGESEIVGHFIEYSGMRFGMFYFAEFLEVVFAAGILTTVFLGGWQFPLLQPDGFHLGATTIPMAHWGVVLIQVATWVAKVLFCCWLQLMIRWTLPRFRPDQLLRLGWRHLLPLSIGNVVVTAAVILLASTLGGRP